MKYLVTGAAGFIGFHFVNKILESECDILILDNLNSYYDPELKLSRISQWGFSKNEIEYGKIIKSPKHWFLRFCQCDLSDRELIMKIFNQESFDYVIHLAAQAGVRYSIQNPHSYIQSNIDGFMNILEGVRNNAVKHTLYASSSSVYGLNTKVPFEEHDPTDTPVSLYAATKKSNEVMAYAYSKLYEIELTGLRFFTVYGPYGRPDMAYYSFTKKIFEHQEIDVFNFGHLRRDFTYVSDIVDGMAALLESAKAGRIMFSTSVKHEIFNIGNNQPVELLEFIRILEKHIGIPAKLRMLPMQQGDVIETCASVEKLNHTTGFKPSTSLEIGLKHFINWYRNYYNIK